MTKRILDLFGGTVLLLLAAVPIVVMALVLAIELRAWPFFLQRRIGKDGQDIAFLKLRTLPADTPAYALKHDLEMSLSPFRAFLRRRHLDELPQLLHVVTGQLSLVGPRPRMPDAHEPVDPYYARRRVTVPQGCTGLWQIGAGTDLLPSESPEYDLFYVTHSSVLLDLWILVRTALQLAGLVPPVTLTEVPTWILRRQATTPAYTLRLDLPQRHTPAQGMHRVIDITAAAMASHEGRELVPVEDGVA